MDNIHNRYSIPEYLGILLMLIGIGLGYFTTYLSAKAYSDSKPAADAFAEPDSDMLQVRDSYIRMMEPTYTSLNKITISRGGVFLFLTGLAVFVVARRRHWNALLDAEISERRNLNAA